MLQADMKRAEPRAVDNVVYLPVATDTYISLFMFASTQCHADAWLPAGWFDLRLVEEGDDGFRLDHIVLDRIEGPPIGSFEIWRETGRFLVERRPETNGWWEGSSRVGRYRTMEEAIRGILAHINGQLVAWGLEPLGACR